MAEGGDVNVELRTALDVAHTYGSEFIKVIDQMILDFFGSAEEAEKQAPFYIIDYTDPVFEMTGSDSSEISYRMTAETFLRKRTPEEMEA